MSDVREGLRKLREVPLGQFNSQQGARRSDNPKSKIENPKLP
jgi:hypothetical protein